LKNLPTTVLVHCCNTPVNKDFKFKFKKRNSSGST